MKSFCKQAECPTSEELVALQNTDARSYTEELDRHLSICEFCSAEASFYRLHPPTPENVEIEQMPQALYELADALMEKKGDMTPLYKLIDNID